VADDPPAIADQGDKYQELITRWKNPSRWPKFRLRTLSAAFSDGTSRPTDADITPAPDGTVRVAARPETAVLSGVCTDQDGHLWMYVSAARMMRGTETGVTGLVDLVDKRLNAIS